MAKREIISCDNCGNDGADSIGPLDLGDGPHLLDLCGDCQENAGIPKLHMLLNEYGVPISNHPYRTPPRASTPKDKSDAPTYKCRVCHRTDKSRGNLIIHCQNLHGLSQAEASQMVPPIPGPGMQCKCGFLAANLQGLRNHERHQPDPKVHTPA